MKPRGKLGRGIVLLGITRAMPMEDVQLCDPTAIRNLTKESHTKISYPESRTRPIVDTHRRRRVDPMRVRWECIVRAEVAPCGWCVEVFLSGTSRQQTCATAHVRVHRRSTDLVIVRWHACKASSIDWRWIRVFSRQTLVTRCTSLQDACQLQASPSTEVR